MMPPLAASWEVIDSDMHGPLVSVVSFNKAYDMHAAKASDLLQAEFLLCCAMARPGQDLHAPPQ